MNDTAKGRNIAPHPFPKAEAERCACCHTPLGTRVGYAVPHIGVVGPKCVNKFAALALAITVLEGLSVYPDSSPTELQTFVMLSRRLYHVGFETRIVETEDGGKAIVAGACRKPLRQVVQSWAERREQFMRDLQLAELQREGRLAAHHVEAA